MTDPTPAGGAEAGARIDEDIADSPFPAGNAHGCGECNCGGDDGKMAPLAPLEPAPPAAPSEFVVVRYGLMRQVGQFRHDLDPPPGAGAKVVVRTERGVELGDVLEFVGEDPCRRCISPQRLAEYVQTGGSEYPFTRDGKVLRRANQQDVIDQRHLESSAHEERGFCRQRIRELNLPMKLICVEHLLGGERIIFYFTAETRVDFRELVRSLAGQYRTRIEMRQVGARDEARLVADYERCGQRCCCQQYLKNLKPVSMRMAKIQKATLDPTKISGRCGRLMCCLRYEDASYEHLRKLLPNKNTWVRTADHLGRVIDTQIITQLVRLALPDNTVAVVANEEIIERDVPPPPMPEGPRRQSFDARPQPARPSRLEPRAPLPPRQDVDIERLGEDLPPASDEADGQPGQPVADGPPDQADGGPARSKRARRRRKRGRSAQSAENATGEPTVATSFHDQAAGELGLQASGGESNERAPAGEDGGDAAGASAGASVGDDSAGGEPAASSQATGQPDGEGEQAGEGKGHHPHRPRRRRRHRRK